MDWLMDNWKFIAIALGAITVLALISYFYVTKSGASLLQGFQNPVDAKHEFIMFYANWCPHCKTVLPEFKEFAETGITVAGQPVKISYYDNASEEAADKKAYEDIKAKGVKVEGFPTFVLVTADGKTYTHTGERTVAAYTKFLNDTLGGKV